MDPQTCLKESDLIDDLVKICEEHETDYVTGLLAFNSLDPGDEIYDPIYLVNEILIRDAEMSPREAITLIANTLNSFINGLVKPAKGEREVM